MNLREAIGEYAVHYGRCQEVIGREGEGVERIRRQFGEVEERLDRAVKVAEAAEAYAAWVVDVPPQATTLDIYATGEGLLREYVAAREAVRKLEVD